MIYLKKITTIILFLFAITSCVEKYFPFVDKYEGVLVVDGMLSNITESTTVKLSISSTIYEEEYIPISGAILNITDQNDVVIGFTETEPGTYKVLDISFCGEVGNSYQLHISLPDGRNYESDICILKSPSPIDSVYGIVESPEVQSGTHLIEGIQFYIDSHSNNISDTSYFFWKLSQTFKYKSTFDIDWVWEGYFYPFPDPDSLRTCWFTSNISEMYLFSSKFLNQSVITKFPLNFVSTESKALSIRYSLLVKQLSISEDAFNFFNELNQQNIEQGDYYSRQPIQIVGNMHNVIDAEELVLGYFIVAGITKKRIYVNRPPIPFYYNICTPDFDLRFVEFYPESAWPIYIDDIMFDGWALGTEYGCFDCREDGGSITPPDFWEE